MTATAHDTPPTEPTDGLRKVRTAELGRRAEIRAEKFLEAAVEVFFEKGYRAARLSDIVGRAGGSMATLYRVYGDKEGLAHAIMDRHIHAFNDSLEVLEDSELPPEQVLPAVAETMVDEMLTPGHIVCHRIVIAEGLSLPELRDWFYAHGVAPAEERLTGYFRRQQEAGRLQFDSPKIAADRFYMLVFGVIILRTVNGRLNPAENIRLRAEARQAVDIFLRGVQPR